MMSAISPVNPGAAALSGLLSSVAKNTVSPVLSSPAVQDALKNASPGDVVDLSLQALQLQQASGLFGGDTSNGPAAADLAVLQSAGATPADVAAESSASAALQQAYGLFGSGQATGGGLFNFFG
jgi:hypothetical protein